jgi:hypothetical protein
MNRWLFKLEVRHINLVVLTTEHLENSTLSARPAIFLDQNSIPKVRLVGNGMVESVRRGQVQCSSINNKDKTLECAL